MKKWNIVADSSCDLKEGFLADDLYLEVPPLKILVGEKEFVDDENLDINEMMDAMHAYSGASTSACPSVGEFVEAFMKAENTICITLTSALRGTYNAAVQARKIAIEKDPSKNIHVIDSKATSSTMILIINETVRLIQNGLSFKEISSKLDTYTKTLHLVFSLVNFDNLIKNGRMSKAAGMLASVVGIRPIAIANQDGEIAVVDKPRGEKKAYKRIIEYMQKTKDLTNIDIYISHNDNIDGANALKTLLETLHKPKSVKIIKTRGLCSFYTDKKGIIVGY